MVDKRKVGNPKWVVPVPAQKEEETELDIRADLDSSTLDAIDEFIRDNNEWGQS